MRTEYCEIENLLQKAIFVLQLLFCESSHYCDKAAFCNIIYKRLYPPFTMFSKRFEGKSSIIIRFQVHGSILEGYAEKEILLQKAVLLQKWF